MICSKSEGGQALMCRRCTGSVQINQRSSLIISVTVIVLSCKMLHSDSFNRMYSHRRGVLVNAMFIYLRETLLMKSAGVLICVGYKRRILDGNELMFCLSLSW